MRTKVHLQNNALLVGALLLCQKRSTSGVLKHLTDTLVGLC